MTNTLKLAVLVPVALLGGCISFAPKAPDSLLTLTSTTTAPVGRSASGNVGNAIVLVPFEAPAILDGTRVPVQVTGSELAYLKDAVWAEKPARLFRRLIAETLRTGSGRIVVDGDDPAIIANDRLGGTVRQFGYDVASSSVVVMFDAVRSRKGADVETRRFEARVSGVEPKAEAVGPALNEAANTVAAEVAEWAK